MKKTFTVEETEKPINVYSWTIQIVGQGVNEKSAWEDAIEGISMSPLEFDPSNKCEMIDENIEAI